MINTPQAPYFDDFNIEKNFLKILFKPKLSVQTRELEQMQSMFQNQIETLASQIFQNGSVVSGGKFSFKEKVNYVKLYNDLDSQTFNYNIYKDRYIYGTTTKILARIFNGWSQSEHEVASLYLDYLTSGDEQQQEFQPGEVLQLVSKVYLSKISGTISVGDTIRGTGESRAVAKVININNNEYDVIYSTTNTFSINEQVFVDETSSYFLCTAAESIIYKAQVKSLSDDENSVGYGSAVYVDEGIYYIDGYFVHTDNQSKIISNYSTNTNARVGFEKEVQIITSNEDPSLLDNANGYPNYNAPGADRLKINLVLDYYNLYETPSENFVEIMTVENSSVTGNSSINQKYSEILDTLARRTYDESGNYTVKPFLINIREFLDDGENNGIYKREYFAYKTREEAEKASVEVFGLPEPGQAHPEGIYYYPYLNDTAFTEACKNRLAVGIEPGKAYVMGYEIDHTSKTWYPLLKARDTKVLNNSTTTVFYGNYIKVNNLQGLPNIYKHQYINLYSDTEYSGSMITIGSARVFAFELESGTAGSTDAVYRVYLENIIMDADTDFSTAVNSIGYQKLIDEGDPSRGYEVWFWGKAIKTNDTIILNNIEKSALIFNMPKSNISSVSDASYNYKKIFTGIISESGGLGTIAISSGENSSFVNIEDQKNYIITILSGPMTGEIINYSSISKSLDSMGNLTFSGIDADSIDCRCMILATLHKTTDAIKQKTLYTNAQFVKSSGDFSEIILDHSDGYRLVGVYDSEDPSVAPTTESTNITDNYIFDNGQRDTYYDLARVKLKDGAISPSGQVLVVFDYFSHSDGDYFTVDSYTGTIDYADIPTYSNSNTTYDLKNCIDLRGRVDDNGSGNFTTTTLPYIMANNDLFESDVEYYLPRLDLLELDYRGKFNIKYGTSSEDPQYPIGSINSMTLYYLSLPAYTENPSDVVHIYCENKRYTMRDIGNIENRVQTIENYLMLGTTEEDTNNLQIFDANGYQCIKTGFIVDVFINHSYGDATVAGYRCSIDPENGCLRPDFKLHTVEFEKSTIRQSTVLEEGGIYMIPYTKKDYITNTINTSYIPLNSNKLVEWEGTVVLNKSLDTVYNVEETTTINYGTPSTADYYGNRSRLSSMLKTYNSYRDKWIGVNSVLN